MKYKILFLLIICLNLVSLYSIYNIVPINCAEHENIDSFNVPPTVRWNNDLTSSDETLTVDNGILNYTDNGEYQEQSAYSRQLSKTDFKIEGRIKTPNTLEGVPYLYESQVYNIATEFANENFTGWYGSYFFNSTSIGIDENNNRWDFIKDYRATDTQDIFRALAGTPRSLTTAQTGAYSCMAITGELYWSNYTVTTRLREFYSKSDSFGLTFRFNNNTDSGNYTYYTVEMSEDDDSVCLYKHNHNSTHWGQRTLLVNYSIVISDPLYQNWHNLTVTVIGDNIKVLFNDSQIIDYTDPNPLYYGYVGIYSRNGNNKCFWDNFTCSPEANTNYTRTIIGLNDITNILDLETPQMGIVFEAYMNRSEVAVYYSFMSDSTLYETNFFNLTQNTWYSFEIDGNLYKSTISIVMKSNTGIEITNSDKELLDISSSIHPDIYNAETLEIFMGNYFYGEIKLEWFLDYINAPFEEYAFNYLSGAEYEGDGFDFVNEFGGQAYANGTVYATESIWRYVVPDFDSCTGTLFQHCNESSYNNIDDTIMETRVRILSLDKDNNLDVLLTLSIRMSTGTSIILYDGIPPPGAGTSLIQIFADDPLAFTNSVEVGFNFYITAGTKFICQLNYNGASYSVTREIDTSEYPYTSEIVVETQYIITGSSAAEAPVYNFGLKDFDTQFRDLLGFLPKLPSPGDIIDFILTPLMIGFRFLASIFGTIIAPVIAAVASLLSPLTSILSQVGSILTEVADIVSGVVDGLVAGLASYFSDVVSAITDLVTDLVQEFIDFIGPILDDAIAWLLTVIDDVMELVLAGIAWVWDNTIETVFPGIGSVLIDIVTGGVELIAMTVEAIDLVLDYSFASVLFLTILIFMGAAVRTKGDDLLEYTFHLFDIMSMIPIRVQVGIAIGIPLGFIWLILVNFWW